MQNEIMTQGLTLMALGMGVVFVFLTLLILTTQLMSTLIERYFPATLNVETQVASSPAVHTGVDPHTLAIIRAAIRKHRQS